MEVLMTKKALQVMLAFVLAALLMPFQSISAASESSNTNTNVKLPGYKFSQIPDIKASSAILVESARGQVLYEKQSSRKLHISAACKIMTALVAIEKADLSSKVTISKESVDAEGSALSLEVGKKYSVEDLLYGIMLTSANDAAKALAEYVGGDINKFVVLMNNKAHELNMKDTHFANPTGLYDESQYTTAYDIALLMKYALSNPTFNRMFSIKAMPWVNGQGEVKILTNQNKLFWSYDGVDGGKTGFNEKDRQTAITTATRGNMRLISIVLDSPENSVFEDSAQILDFGFDNYKTSILVSKDSPQKTIQIGDKEINLVSISDVYYTHPIGESYIKSFECTTIPDLNPPINKNSVVGTARYVLNDNTVISIDLYPDTEILPPEDFRSSIKKVITENKDIFYLLLILVFIEVILIIYNIIKFIKRLIKRTSMAERK